MFFFLSKLRSLSTIVKYFRRKKRNMRLSTFRENDNVLLVGEGNFSFAASLVLLNLQITITASCYESSVINENTRKNLKILSTHGQYQKKEERYRNSKNQYFVDFLWLSRRSRTVWSRRNKTPRASRSAR